MTGLRKSRRTLTARQIEVLVLAARGDTYKSIATKLGLAEVTVGYHLSRLQKIFLTDSMVGLVTSAIVYGVLSASALPIESTGQTFLDL